MEQFIVFVCPHCSGEFSVHAAELNCRIVRHFVFKDFQQLNPHAPKEECERVVREELGYGCAGPVELFSGDDGQWSARICGYI